MMMKLGLSLLLLAGSVVGADWLLPPTVSGVAFARDAAGQVVARTAPGGRLTRYGWDSTGGLTAIGNYRVGGLTGFPYPTGPFVAFTRDAAGSLTALKDGTGISSFTFDELGRLAKVTAPDGRTIAHSYDPWGHVATVTTPSGFRVEYAYDIADRVVRVDAGQGAVTYEYLDKARRIVRRLPNGVSTAFDFDEQHRLVHIRHERLGRLLASFRYVLDGHGRARELEEADGDRVGTTRYEYDVEGRLSKVVGPDGHATAFEFDAAGNRLARHDDAGTTRYAYDAEGRLIRAGDTTYTWDSLGNLISKQQGSRTTVYTWDEAGRLVEVRPSDAEAVRYIYNGEGHRVGRVSRGKTMRYLHDLTTPLPHVVAEYREDGSQERDYTMGVSRLAQRDAGGQDQYLLEDRLGSTRLVVDHHGEVVARYAYSPFGTPLAAERTADTSYQFTGEPWDADTGLLYLRARYFDPEIGRFISADPLADGAGLSATAFIYADNDPVNHVDPTGLQPNWVPPMPTTPRPPPTISNPARQVALMNRGVTTQVSRARSGIGATDPQWLPFLLSGDAFSVQRGGSDATRSFQHAARGTIFGLAAFSPIAAVGAYTLAVNDLIHDARQRQADSLRSAGALTADLSIDVTGRSYDGLVKAGGTVPGRTGALLRGGQRVSSFVTFTQAVNEFTEAGAFAPLFNAVDRYSQSAGAAPHRRSGPAFYSRTLNPFPPDRVGREALFMPPPWDGGGGAMPSVGGVYLNESVKMLADIGEIKAAVFDQASGQMLLVGDRRTSLPPMKPEYLAEAIKSVYTPGPLAAGMTIDPEPSNPTGPTMVVRFFGTTENTSIGMVMFESDRVMKGYSVGADNLTREPVRSQIPGYRSVTDLDVNGREAETGLWSRFWLTPDPVVARTGDAGRTLQFEPVKIRVRTETMRWSGSALVPAGDVRDPHAETFARHFTDQYEDYEREKPVYAELRQVAHAVALARWMKEQHVPIDWNFVRAFSSRSVVTPTTTPTARFEASRRDGRVIRTISAFGGVGMDARFDAHASDAAEALGTDVRAAWVAAKANGLASFPIQTTGTTYSVLAFPVTARRDFSGYDTEDLDLPAVSGDLPGLPGLARHYTSLHNEPTEFGRSWSLLMPRLEFEAPGKPGEDQFVSIQGRSAQVRVQRFVLTNAFGLGEERFETHAIDQQLARIFFRPSSSSSVFRGIYPEGDEGYRLVFTNGTEAVFDSAGRLRVVLKGGQRVLYEYAPSGSLARVRIERDGHTRTIALGYDVRGRITAMRGGDADASYEYDVSGNLAGVTRRGERLAYHYNDKGLLTDIAVDGRLFVQNSYDGAGRLLAQARDESGIEQRVSPGPDGGQVVTLSDGARQVTRRYDTLKRLVEVRDGDQVYRVSHGPDGRRGDIETTLPSGARVVVDLAADGRVAGLIDPRGVRSELRVDATGRPSELVVGRQRAATYKYDGDSLVAIEYGGGAADRFAYDSGGRLVEYRRVTGAPGVAPAVLRFTY